MTRRATLGIILGIAAMILVVVVFRQQTAPKGYIALGVGLPLSGDAAPYGKEGLNGMNLGAEEINAGGGIAGHPIQLLVEDDKGTVKDGVAALNKLLAQNPNLQVFIGGAFSQIAAAQIPICDRKGIVLFSPYASNPDLSKPGDCFFCCRS